jgi:hypothetical protein
MATSSPKRLKPEQLRAVLKGLHGSSSDHQAPRSAAAHTYDEALQSRYLLVVDPAKLPSLLKQVLTPALLAAMICTLLRQTMIEDEHAALQLLSGLPRVPRFSMNVLSLSSAQRKEIASAWDKTMGSLEGHEIKAQLQEIRDASYSTL